MVRVPLRAGVDAEGPAPALWGTAEAAGEPDADPGAEGDGEPPVPQAASRSAVARGSDAAVSRRRGAVENTGGETSGMVALRGW
jgi:hypothetical protein